MKPARVTPTGQSFLAVDSAMGTNDYKCLDCGDEFDTATAMNNHINTTHNEGYGYDRKFIESVDHIEMVHEREIAPGTTHQQVALMHVEMHRNRDDWGHQHTRKGDTIWDESITNA